jgi:aldehyde:ferredoxin oxidoreductase
MFGWAGNVIRVDLTEGKVVQEPLDPGFARKWYGCHGFLQKAVFDEYDFAERDPLSPRNIVAVAPGALTGTFTPGSQRLGVAVALSPSYGGYLDGFSGGHFGPELKYAGYDLIVFYGKSPKPVYLRIQDDLVELRDARHLWGKTVRETDRLVKEEMGDPRYRTLLIGPAGENRVHGAMAVADLSRCPAGGSTGAVMGSKNLKGMVVLGTRGVKVADPEACFEAFDRIYQKNRAEPRFQVFGQKGTKWLVALSGVLNCQYNVQNRPFDYAKVNADRFLEDLAEAHKACHTCFQHCDHFWKIKSGKYAGECGCGGEAGSIIPMGPMVGNDDFGAIMHFVKRISDLGIDSITLGSMLATAMHWFQDGLLTEKHTGGLTLEWGNVDVIETLIDQIVRREGFGAHLAEGVFDLAEKVARWNDRPLGEVTAYIRANRKKREVGADFRPLKGLAFSKAIDIRECDILNIADTLMAEGPVNQERFEHLGVPSEFAEKFGFSYVGNPAFFEDKAMVKHYSDNHCAVANSLGICLRFTTWAQMRMGLEDMAMCVRAATGIETTWQDLFAFGERCRQLEKGILLMHGFRKEHDYFPDDWYNVPVESGMFEGALMDREEFTQELEKLYTLRGWDGEGFPRMETLEKLDLCEEAKRLEKLGLLSRSP